jgi:hypothetical protein
LIGIGGAGVQLSLQSVSALFPRNKSLVMSSLSGAFQAASGLFLVFELLNDAVGASRQVLLVSYAGVVLGIALASLIIWPDIAFGVKRVKARWPGSALPAAAAEGTAQAVIPAVPLKERRIWGQASSPEFLLMLLYFTINALQCQFTVGTIGLQMENKGDADGAATRGFSLALALSFLATPLIGTAFDRLGFTLVFALVNTLLLGVPATLLFTSLRAQVLTCVLYSAGRVGLWASFFAFMGATFGFRNYGKLAGGGLMVQACVSLLQYPLLAISLGPLRNDFTFVNVLFIALTGSQYITIFALRRRLGEGKAHVTCCHCDAALGTPSRQHTSTRLEAVAIELPRGTRTGR